MKKIALVLAIILGGAPANADFIAHGDSITVGIGANPPSNSWFSKLAVAQPSGTSYAVSNTSSGDTARVVTGHVANPEKKYILMIGTNDARIYKGSQEKQAYYEGFVRHIIVWLTAPNLKKARTSPTAVFTGTWSNPSGYTYGKYSTQQGATYTEAFSGDALYLGYMIQQAAVLSGALADVLVDGVKVGEITPYAPGMLTAKGYGFATAVKRYSGFGAGQHTVTVEVKSSGKIIYVDYVAGSEDLDSAGFLLSNVIPMGADGYAKFGINDAVIQQYNAILSGIVSELSSDGLPITLVDSYSAIDPATEILPAPDGVHPNNSGHDNIYNEFLAAF